MLDRKSSESCCEKELFVIAPEILKDLESCKNMLQLQMGPKRNKMTNRQLRKLHSDVFKGSSTWSFSLEKAPEKAVPQG